MPHSRIGLLLALVLVQSGCASLPNGKPDSRDRFERFNRSVYRFNDAADRAVIKPMARGYVKAVPAPVRRGIGNFLNNLSYPRTIINDVLQGKLRDGARDTGRLVVNTVAGLGFFDPATRMGLEANDEDFGQTLGKWGVPSGPYLMLPLLGPSTIRDTAGLVPDDYTTVRHYIDDDYVRWGLIVLNGLDARAGLLDTEGVLDETYDRYAFVRNSWLQRREYQVRDGDVPADDLLDPEAEAAPAP